MILSIINHKGGTGKTTTAVNLGYALAQEGGKVLLVDLDAQANLSFSLGIPYQAGTIADVMVGNISLQEAIRPAGKVDVLPSAVALADVELSLAGAADRLFRVKEVLAMTHGYDFILLDCPPSLSLISANALVAADAVIIPMQMEVLSVRGLELMLETIARIKQTINRGLEVLGVLPVMVDTRKNLHHEIVEHIQKNYKVRIFKQSIRTSVKAAEAPSFGKSLIEYSPASSTAVDYQRLAGELINYGVRQTDHVLELWH